MVRQRRFKPSAVITEEKILFDYPRRRRLSVLVSYPRGSGTFPAVLFSPGTALPPRAYHYLGKYWARFGFLTVIIGHHGSTERIDHPSHFLNRSADASFVLNRLPRLASRLRFFRGHVDMDRVGMAGHSHGAFCTLILSGARVHKSDGSDPRFKSYLALSPPGAGPLGMSRGSYRHLKGPFMTVSGTEDVDHTFKKKARWRWDPFLLAPSSVPGFHALIGGLNHYSFIDGITFQEKTFTYPDPGALKNVSELGLAFWNHTLRDDRTALSSYRKKHGQNVRLRFKGRTMSSP